MSEYIAKASIEPRDYRVVFLIQKGDIALDDFRSSDISSFRFSLFFIHEMTCYFMSWTYFP